MNLKRFFAQAGKLLIFLLIAAFLFGLTNVLFLPKWGGTWKSTDTVAGFYNLDEDRIDTLIVGSSQVISGVSSLQLYQEQGIRAYGLATERQPLMGSYYLLKDSLRTQPHLTTVVLEVTELFAQCEEAYYRKAFDYMPNSSTKREAVQAHIQWAEKADAENSTDTAPSQLSYLLPIVAFHDRWYELNKDDFTYFFQDHTDPDRGFSIQPDQGAKHDYQTLDTDSTAVCAAPEEEGLFFFRAICALCEEHNLSLVLLKTPRTDWTIQKYNTVNALAKEYSLPYLDFNTEDLNSAIGFDFSKDNMNRSSTHLNLFGAQKLTAYLGQYLAEHYTITDVRKDSKYAYLNQELVSYQQRVNDAALTQEKDFKSYLSRLYQKRYSVLISLSPEDTDVYPADIKRALEQFGLDPRMTSDSYYTAVVEGGVLLSDQWNSASSALTVDLKDDTHCTLTSDSQTCSILVDGTEEATDDPGLNLVVYNHETGQVVDSVTFHFTETGIKTTR